MKRAEPIARPRRIDAHQHFWQLARGDYAWLTPAMRALYRDFGPDDLRPLLDSAGIDASIVVQAAATEAETEYLLKLKSLVPWILGVVGWIDFERHVDRERLQALRARGLVGVRPMLQDINDVDWILRPQFAAVLQALTAEGLVFDALIRPIHLDRITAIAERYPALPLVIDHCAKPGFARKEFAAWRDSIRRAARLLTEPHAPADAATLRTWVDIVLTAFGPDRVLWGSDWPVVTLAAPFSRWHDVSQELLVHLPRSDIDAITGGTAARIYGIPT
jgi:L-fuconolactonase